MPSEKWSTRLQGKGSYAGLFVVTLATTMYEMLLTRIFSVQVHYHLAFVTISLAMFGMTVGAIIVYLLPKYFSLEKALEQLSAMSLIFSVTTITSFLLVIYLLGHYSIPVPLRLDASFSWLLSSFLLASLPFMCSGICACVALTKLPQPIGQLYAADLVGAACGCFMLVPLLELVDGPSAVFVIAGISSLAGICFAAGGTAKSIQKLSAVMSVLLITAGIANSIMVQQHSAPLRLYKASDLIYEKWNCFSRVIVLKEPPHIPRSWGLSTTWPSSKKIDGLYLLIDKSAQTELTKFNGDLQTVEHLKYDLVNLAHYLRSNAHVLVMGVGGGRDVLSALAFHQKFIEGVEINRNILALLSHEFADYTGNLGRYPQIRLVADEARSFVARSRDKFDIIQISLIDTSAASAAGAYVFTEHSLYTLEAWKNFLDHLTPTGVLSVCRWYSPQHPAEVCRITALAATALGDSGIRQVRRHIIIVASPHGGEGGRHFDGIAAMLVSKSPFSQEDIDKVNSFAKQMRFQVLLSPAVASSPILAALSQDGSGPQLWDRFPIDVSPPTDDRPFYLFFLRLKDIFNPAAWHYEQEMHSSDATTILVGLLLVVTVLTAAFIFVPLSIRKTNIPWKNALPLLLFFGSIGMGFMFVEISQLQRLVLFLGHPTYGLSVVLFTLLLASGVGSYATTRLSAEKPTSASINIKLLGALLFVLIVFGLLTPLLTPLFESAVLPVRILETILVLFPLGIFMGVCFPIGMTLAKTISNDLTPWLWGVNGATSVQASVLVMVVCLFWGISAAYWCGFAFYVIAALAYIYAARPRQ